MKQIDIYQYWFNQRAHKQSFRPVPFGDDAGLIYYDNHPLAVSFDLLNEWHNHKTIGMFQNQMSHVNPIALGHAPISR